MLSRLWGQWEKFWFEADGRAQIRVFRPVFALLLFWFELNRFPDLDLYYSAGGIAPLGAFSDAMDMTYRWSIFNHFAGHSAIFAAHLTLLLSLLMLALGFFPRFFAIIGFLLHVSYMHRNPAVLFGVDTVSNFSLFFLCLSDFRGGGRVRKDFLAMLGSVAYRLMQIQVCVIYFYSGLDKMQGPAWWRGDAIWYVLGNMQLATQDFTWVSRFPMIVVFLTYSTLLWEIYFPMLVWVPGLRAAMLVFGVLLHAGIGVTMNLYSFGALMMVNYLLFADRQWALGVARAFQGATARILPKVLLGRADRSYV